MSTNRAHGGDPMDWFDAAGATHYRRLFASTPAGRRLLYADMLSETARIAAALAQCGVQPGERVLCRIEKSLDAVLLYLACLRYGAVFVPVNPAATPAEFDYLLRDAQPRLIVLDPHAGPEVAAVVAGAPSLTLAADGTGSLAELAERSAPLALEHAAAAVAGAVAAIVYTSGTTGRPKGAMLTRANLASNAGALARAWRFVPDDVLLHVLPLFHVHGLFVALNTVLASGASLVLQPKFEPQAALA
ncbi:MAG TPA: AMP-binding protein, partial [Steroidobacteraceae bacterium]|nr:AMP-binding protein [Steroidobacteraceae bacterium]